MTHVQFEVADLATFDMDQMFDALTGHFVLLYLPNPAATLRCLARHLRPGATPRAPSWTAGLHDDAVANERVTFLLRLVGAWTKLSPKAAQMRAAAT